jgi:hypothetical protein
MYVTAVGFEAKIGHGQVIKNVYCPLKRVCVG